MTLATWLLQMVSPLIGRILTTLGFSVVSIVGMEAVITQIKQRVIDGVNSLPAQILDLFLFAGGGVGLGIIFGAIATRVLMWQISSSTKLLGVNPQ